MLELEKILKTTDWHRLMEEKELAGDAMVNLALFAEGNKKTYKKVGAQRAAIRSLLDWITDMQTAAEKDGWPVEWDINENPHHEWSDEHGDLIDTRTGKPLG